jgi:hypothetical protein
MIDWDSIGDEGMRRVVLLRLEDGAKQYADQADRCDDRVAKGTSVRDRRDAEACARYSRRQAAHYQWAIDLLTAAPMPERSEEP